MKYIVFIFFAIPVVAWGWILDFGSIMGPPQNLNISTYAIDNYSASAEAGLTNLPRSVAEKNRFVEQISKRVNFMYPNTTVFHIRDKENASATANSFLTDNTDNSEIVFFSGHGGPQTLYFYDHSHVFLPGTKRFGGRTRWVFIEACLFMNMNREDRISATASSENMDMERKRRMSALFNGVHAILGNYADGYQWTIKKHWYSSARWRTEDRFDYFAQYFIMYKFGIWDAYVSALKKVYKNFTENSALGSDGSKHPGYRPAIVYFYKSFSDGSVMDMSLEKYGETYNVPVSDGSISDYILKYKTVTIGSPIYY
jgi:hypothetical protein